MWPDADFTAFTPYDLLHANGSPFFALLYVQLFWPEFVQYEVFPWVLEDDDDGARVLAELERSERTSVEKAFNFVPRRPEAWLTPSSRSSRRMRLRKWALSCSATAGRVVVREDGRAAMSKPVFLEALRAMSNCLPLQIGEISWADPVLVIRGAGWDFNTWSAWRLRDAEKIIIACGDDRAAEAVRPLAGQSIIRVFPQSGAFMADPAFELTDGTVLEVFATDTFEPWTLHLPSGEIFVA